MGGNLEIKSATHGTKPLELQGGHTKNTKKLIQDLWNSLIILRGGAGCLAGPPTQTDRQTNEPEGTLIFSFFVGKLHEGTPTRRIPGTLIFC